MSFGVDLKTEWLSRVPGLERLWSTTTGDSTIKVAVLDGPIAGNQPAATGQSASGVVEHGTLVASIISGSCDGTAPGIAPGCTLLSIPIFRNDAEGPAISSQETLADAIRTALSMGARIINISAAQQGGPLAIATELSGALRDALAEDVLVVAAAGNHGCACDTIPASAEGVLAVGAHDETGRPLLISN